MNPSPIVMAILDSRHERERRAEAEHRYRLHAKAVTRRRKAKRGGPR